MLTQIVDGRKTPVEVYKRIESNQAVVEDKRTGAATEEGVADEEEMEEAEALLAEEGV